MNIQAIDNLIKAVDDLDIAMDQGYECLCDIDILHTDGVKHCYECVFHKGRNEGCMLQNVLALKHEIQNVYDEKIKNKLVN